MFVSTPLRDIKHQLDFSSRKAKASSELASPRLSIEATRQRSAVRPVDRAIEWSIAALLAFSPFAFGSVEPWSETVVIGLVGLAALFFSIKLLVLSSSPLLRTWAYLPLGMFLSISVLQLARLPEWVLSAISPNTSRLVADLLANLSASGSGQKWATLSLYPGSTRHGLRILFAVSALFLIAVNTYRDPRSVRRLLLTIVIIGSACSTLAFAQDVSGAKYIYWVRPTPRMKANSGPFVNYSHYGQFINLCIGAGLALLLPILDKTRLAAGSRRLQTWAKWLLCVAMTLALVTIFLAGSRGAIIGLVTGLGVGLIVFFCTRRANRTASIGLGAGLVVCVLTVFVGPDAIFNRVSTLNSYDAYADRVQIVKDLTRCWRLFPVFGTGLGTHEFVFPMFDTSARRTTATHAENEYAQILEETGGLGLATFLCFLAVLVGNYVRAVRTKSTATQYVAIGIAVGLVAVLAHSLSDFGQHLPPNAALSATLVAIMFNLGTPRATVSREGNLSKTVERWSIPSAIVFRFALCAGLLISLGWAFAGSLRAAKADVYWRRAAATETLLTSTNWDGANLIYAQLIDNAAEAARIAPENVIYRYSESAYRWHALCRVRNPQTGEIVLGARNAASVGHILADLADSEPVCPTYSHTYCLSALIQTTINPENFDGLKQARVAYHLNDHDLAAGLLVAKLDAAAGNWAESRQEFQRYLAVGGNFSQLIQCDIIERNRADQALAVAAGDAAMLLQLSRALAVNDPNLSGIAEQRAVQAASGTGTSPETLAQLAQNEVDAAHYRAAVQLYRKALAADYKQTGWHLGLARALASEGDVESAIQEAKICVRLQSNSTEARQLLGELFLSKTVPKS